MAGQALSCPRCGDAASIIQLRVWRAWADDRAAEAREAAARRAAESVSKSSSSRSGQGGGGDSLPYGVDDLVSPLVLGGLVWAWRKVIWNPFKARVVPALARAQQEASSNFSAAVDRHPELWLCPRDNVVFRVGGTKTVPSHDAIGWLRRGDDVKLAAALDEN